MWSWRFVTKRQRAGLEFNVRVDLINWGGVNFNSGGFFLNRVRLIFWIGLLLNRY